MKEKEPSKLPFNERLAASISETAEKIGVSRNTVYLMLKQGQLSAVHCGARNMVTTASIRALLEGKAA